MAKEFDYDLFVIGAGSGGTRAARVAAGEHGARVGVAEARIEQAATRNNAARTSLEYSRNKLIAADPYETAAQLQTVQFQLESLYSVTVRNANLSLVNFLR